jgi:hypothetical protein
MSKKKKAILAVLILLAIFGAYMGDFLGGILCGFFGLLSLTYTIGNWAYNKSINNLEKTIRDHSLGIKNQKL